MTYSQQLYIDKTASAARAALLLGGQVCELHIERFASKNEVGNVYRGKVVRVIPSMQAAFVDIGLSQPGFLHRREFLGGGKLSIEKLVHEGQSLIVQVTKAPRAFGTGSKGASLTTDVKLVGRSMIYLPQAEENGVVVSKRLSREVDHQELHSMIADYMINNGLPGRVILRQAAIENRNNLSQEIGWLAERWQLAAQNTKRAPALLVPELPFAQRMVRDLDSSKSAQIIVADRADIDQLQAFAAHSGAASLPPPQCATPSIRATLSHTIQSAIERALATRVPLDNGGELVIEATEAMTVVDVNTASAVAGENLYHQTNLLAAAELARQLRLRKIGGMVIADFITTSKPSERAELLRVLRECLAKDPARTSCGAHSELGLIEITRERQYASLAEQLQSQCEACHGSGRIRVVDY